MNFIMDTVHVTDAGSLFLQFHLMDLKGRASAFDSFRNKAKKSLTNSFENLLLRVGVMIF